MNAPVDLDVLRNRLKELHAECEQRGMSLRLRERIIDLVGILPNIEQARQAQDRSNG